MSTEPATTSPYWTCFTVEGIRTVEGDDLAAHAEHYRCVREVHVEGCELMGLRGDYACHGECSMRAAGSGSSPAAGSPTGSEQP